MKKSFVNIFVTICIILVLGILSSCNDMTQMTGTTGDGADNYDTRPIVCFGNSLTYGYGASSGNTYPYYLQEKIKVQVINAGVNGDTTEKGLERLNKDVLEKNPQLVIIEFGGNDLFNDITVTELKNNLEEMIEIIDNGKRKIYVSDWIPDSAVNDVSLILVNSLRVYNGFSSLTLKELNDFVSGYRTVLVSLSTKVNVEIVEDIYAGIYGDASLMSDPLHPNSLGYKIMADNYFAAIEPYLLANNLLK